MHFYDTFLACYGWEGAALAGAMLVMLGVQLYYYIGVYGRIAGYRDSRRAATRSEEPPVSVVVPLFSEDYSFVEERLPLILAQNYSVFEVIIVYVGHDSDFYEDLSQLKGTFPQIFTTKIQLDPRFPISRKMALNVGIKSAHYEHLVFTSTDAVPQSDRWLALMAKGFTRGEIVVGYCGMEYGKGFTPYMMRVWRMMHSANWIARAVRHRPYRGTLHNFGFTKSLYFGVNGFSHLNMNIGEDDLFMQRVMRRDNVSVILSPRATLREKRWGRDALVDESAALLRLGLPLLSRGGPQLRRLGDRLAVALLPRDAYGSGRHACGVQARGPVAAAGALCRRRDRGSSRGGAPGRGRRCGPLLHLRSVEPAVGGGAAHHAAAPR